MQECLFYNGKVLEYGRPAKVVRRSAGYPTLKTETRKTDSNCLLQDAAFSQHQYLYQPGYDLAPAFDYCVAPPYPMNSPFNVQYYTPPAIIGGLDLAPPVSFMLRRQKKTEGRPAAQQQLQQQTYVKKPLNAYMLFLKEQRPHVKAEIKNKGGNAVIAFLVAQWKTLPKKQKAKYFKEANHQRLLHRQQNPGWSNKVNYGKKLGKARKIKTGMTF